MSLTRIALAGEGGQGVQSIAEILVEAAYNQNQQTLYIPNFGLEQRGGVSIAFIQFSDQRIGAPKFNRADVVIAVSERAVPRTAVYSGPETIFVYDSSIEVGPEVLPSEARQIISIPALEMASKELHPRVFNIIIMGAVIGITGVVSFEATREAMEHKLAHVFEKNPAMREMNYRALEIGGQIAEKAIKKGVVMNG